MQSQQDTVARVCAICEKTITEFEWMMDLFREESSEEESNRKVEWVHTCCAKQAIQRWLLKKRNCL